MELGPVKLPDVLKQSPERPYVLAVHEIISPNPMMPAFDEVARCWCKVPMDLKSIERGLLVWRHFPIRDLFNCLDECVEEIHEF